MILLSIPSKKDKKWKMREIKDFKRSSKKPNKRRRKKEKISITEQSIPSA